jgi:hypothetical protein
MKRSEIEQKIIFWRVLSFVLAVLLAAQSFNILTGTAQ